ncbi:hypothetical protein JCM16163A_21320 [Paenibacillus sp. YK5]
MESFFSHLKTEGLYPKNGIEAMDEQGGYLKISAGKEKDNVILQINLNRFKIKEGAGKPTPSLAARMII